MSVCVVVLIIQLKQRGKVMKTNFKYRLMKDFILRYEKSKKRDNTILSILKEMITDYEVELINEEIKTGKVELKQIKKGGVKK